MLDNKEDLTAGYLLADGDFDFGDLTADRRQDGILHFH